MREVSKVEHEIWKFADEYGGSFWVKYGDTLCYFTYSIDRRGCPHYWDKEWKTYCYNVREYPDEYEEDREYLKKKLESGEYMQITRNIDGQDVYFYIKTPLSVKIKQKLKKVVRNKLKKMF